MTNGQIRVILLLLLLLALEAVRHPGVKQFFRGAGQTIGQTLAPKK